MLQIPWPEILISKMLVIGAGLSDDLLLPVLACVCVGLSAFTLVWVFTSALRSGDLQQDADWRYDVSRINELRQRSPFYRTFQPLILGLAKLNRRLFPEQLPGISREIQVAGLLRYWSADEYLARLQVIGLLVFPVYCYALWDIAGVVGIVMAIVAMVTTVYVLRRRLSALAAYRLARIKRRLPFLLDLLTLLLEAGSTFLQALAETVDEFQDHPVGMEFGRVLSEISMGKSRTAALEAFRDRMRDDEITSIVGSVIQGENLGTPLAQIFHAQADVLRMKRTQRAETIAGEAGVKMLLPAILIMASTVLIILGPFVLGFIYNDFMS